MTREEKLDIARALAYAVPRTLLVAAVAGPVLAWLPGAMVRNMEREEAAAKAVRAMLPAWAEEMAERRETALKLLEARGGAAVTRRADVNAKRRAAVAALRDREDARRCER